jgi:acyl carrier protein
MGILNKVVGWIEAREAKQSSRYADNYAHCRETPEQFISACRAKGAQCPKEIILGIRRVIARLGKIDDSFINSGDTFDCDLIHLPFWDSLDAIAIVMELEVEFQTEINDKALSEMLNPDLARKGTTVADAVLNWGRVIAKIRSQNGSSE